MCRNKAFLPFYQLSAHSYVLRCKVYLFVQYDDKNAADRLHRFTQENWIVQGYKQEFNMKIFGSDRSPRGGDVVRACVRPSVCYFPQIMSSSSILKSPGGF